MERKLTHVADLLQIIGKHNNRKRTRSVVFAEIQIVNSLTSGLDPQNFSANALGLADVFLRLIKRNTCSGRNARNKQGESCKLGDHTEILVGYRANKAPHDKNMYELSQKGTARGQPNQGRPPQRQLPERLNRSRLVVPHVENRIELGDL